MTEPRRDIWAEWLAVHRYGGDPEVRRRMLEETRGFREKVLDRSGLEDGETLLDVGCGEGLIGFGALDRGARHVVFPRSRKIYSIFAGRPRALSTSRTGAAS